MVLPTCTRTVAIGGLGNGACLLRYGIRFQHVLGLYWDDLDGEGIAILYRVRAIYPAVSEALANRSSFGKCEISGNVTG